MKKLILIFFLIYSFPVLADGNAIVTSAKKQIGITTSYDPGYVRLNYPGGDVDKTTGVCADVVIRALREHNIDLQKEVHEDMKNNFHLYPKNWGLTKTDTNIDHRRVPNLEKYFSRHHQKLPLDKDFMPGDIITWNLREKGFLPHIGIVSDKKTASGIPLIIHNIGSGTIEEDILFDYKITGHYRIKQ